MIFYFCFTSDFNQILKTDIGYSLYPFFMKFSGHRFYTESKNKLAQRRDFQLKKADDELSDIFAGRGVFTGYWCAEQHFSFFERMNN